MMQTKHQKQQQNSLKQLQQLIINRFLKEILIFLEKMLLQFQKQEILAQRETFFNLSDNMIALTKEFKLSENPIYVQYCPMADGSWLSDEKKIMNPYYGKSMLSCGSVKSEIK
jgi:hypothetical protein